MGNARCLLLLLVFLLPLAQGRTWLLSLNAQTSGFIRGNQNLYLELYGTTGQTSQVLQQDGFVWNGVEQFTFDFDIGEIYKMKIRKEHQRINDMEHVYVDWLKLEDSKTGKIYRFHCRCIVVYIDVHWTYSDPPVCYDIEHCLPGYKECGPNDSDDFSYSQCHRCEHLFYSGGWYGGCQSCEHIDHCVERYCSNAWDLQCLTCEHNNVLFKPSYAGTTCQDMCSYNNYCWPGNCVDGYASYCNCADGFTVSSDASEKSCQLSNSPTIETCHTEAEGPNLEKKRSGSSGPTNECQYETDFYGNFMPVKLHYDLFAALHIYKDSFPSQPDYIDTYKFGVTDATITTVFETFTGTENVLDYSYPLVDNSSSVNAVPTFNHAGNMKVLGSNLSNGDRLCLMYLVHGGGFLIGINTSASNLPRLPPKAYQKTFTTRKVCYRFDDTPPQHCLESSTCSTEPLKLEKRISKTPDLNVEFQGWTDPIPPGGNADHASSVEIYQIIVNEMSGTYSILKVGTEVVFSEKVNASENSMRVNVPAGLWRLYCVTLDVKDFADNVRQARRFFLYDNSTFITVRPDKKFYVSSASVASNHQWQSVDGDTCLDWNDYFYNPFYMDNNLLARVETDPHGLISGVYEQISGDLPVTGTPSVYGILKFMFSYAKNSGNFSDETEVSNFLDQKLCTRLDFNDGDTYALKIRAIDIANNSYSEDRVVHIDGSAPHISDIGLQKDGFRKLYVHDETNLSKMDFQFDAYDPHSGIHTVEWSFGITDFDDVVANGMLAVNHMNQVDCLEAEVCYCPVVGDCEIMQYSIPLHGLVTIHKHIGYHNKEYYFTIKVTNNALLTSIETMVILVDDSAPEIGIVLEGPVGYNDIDYISDGAVSVNWHGFIDHESGIRLYRVGIADRCLLKAEVYQMSDSLSEATFVEVVYPENTVQLSNNFTGKYYVTVIAINNAMDPSDPVCSDGISVDTTPPEFLHVMIENARWAESIYCFENKAWFLRSDLVKQEINDTSACSLACSFGARWPLIAAIPSQLIGIDGSLRSGTHVLKEMLEGQNSSIISQLLCSAFPVYRAESAIYLPDDYIDLSWDISETLIQIQDFYVGIGESCSEKRAPGLMDYLSSNKKHFFKINHAGIGTEKEFFIFLKAVNKAGIETVLTIGPMIVDQTPPRCQFIPDVHLDGDDVVVGWQNDTFYDYEQTTEIDRISFQIEHDNKAVSPLIVWRKITASQCHGYTGGCFKYSKAALQKQDTDLALKFYVKIQVYNIAGHFLTVTTDEFTLPSMYPPAHAVITDIDPSDGTGISFDKADVDAHFSTNTVCAIWKGFDHHEEIHFEFGIGSEKGLNDVFNFTQINHSNNHCLVSTNIVDGVKMYINLRATSSAGSTVASSDGITIYKKSQVFSQLNVFDGPECFIPRHLIANKTYISNERFELSKPLIIGKIYTLRVFSSNIPTLDTTSQDWDIYLKDIKSDTLKHDLLFQPYNENPRFYFLNTIQGSFKLELYDCVEDIPASVDTKTIMAHWSGLVDYFTYEAAVVTLLCSDKSDSSCLNFHSPFSPVQDKKWISNEIILQPQSTYYTGVRACLNSVCTSMKLSSGVKIVSDTFTVDIIKAESGTTSSGCISLLIGWKPLYHVNISFYQWSVTAKIKRSATESILGQWRTVSDSDTQHKFVQVEDCVFLPIHSFQQLFACVRAFDYIGQKTQRCKQINDTSALTGITNKVYEFDVSGPSWDDIRTIIRSRYVGDSVTTLHQEDFDFGTERTELIGAVLNGYNRNITWYLTITREMPNSCDDTLECKASAVTSDGYVNFSQDKIKYNTVDFICANAETVDKITDTFIEQLPAIHGCSDGFVIDNKPPIAGEILVENVNGFINNLDEFAVTWSGFEDNIDVSKLGYENKIDSTFEIEIGSSPSRRDIKHYSDLGGTASLVVNDLMLNSGDSLFVSVIATDYAGLHTRVSSNKFVVDVTPPTVGKIILRSATMSKWTSESVLLVQLIEFADRESGIDKYITHVGSSQYKMDVLSESEHTTEMIELNLNGGNVVDGHMYYLGVKAKNRAGLFSEYTFVQFGVDQTPPTGGHVMDGSFSSDNKDIDFQINVNFIRGDWKGFVDPHSDIAYYTAGIGTDALVNDVEPKINVGLRREMMWNSTFTAGQKFWINVEACNHAGLCHVVSSDGIILDDSPPIAGVVTIGSSGRHHTYIPVNSLVQIFWSGFEDPQISMQRYEACLGTSPYHCDLVPAFDCLLTTSHMTTRIDMPLNQSLFATVIGYNNNDQTVSKSSRYFIVDSTPPELVIRPKFVARYFTSESISVQTEKSILNIMWKFSDPESAIMRHIVTLATHHEGHTPIEHVELGNIDRVTMSLDSQNWLHNGDTYKVSVTACNSAGLCLTAESDGLLIDSTPPHMGGFNPQMTWQNFVNDNDKLLCEVSLSWYGFCDHESGIKNFYVGVGNSFAGNELSKGLVEIKADTEANEYNASIAIDPPVSDKTVLSVVAENNAGLMSTFARITLLSLISSPTDKIEDAHGLLEIETHSCDIHYCSKDCTCAVIGKVCSDVQTNITCSDVTASLDSSFSVSVDVYGGLDDYPYQITASASCLSAHWIINEGIAAIQRFEWSMGIKNEAYGKGIFDLPDERPWIDVGKFRSGIYCLPLNRSLIHAAEYVIYVKAWVEMDSYLLFQSQPILVDQTPPAVRRGKFVKESDMTCISEYDLIYWKDKISACWAGVFYETEGRIVSYIVGLGTQPGADDVMYQRNVDLITRIDAEGLRLSSGEQYYFTVTAYNNVGLHTSVSSDGFIIDVDRPICGIVYNTIRYRNYAFHSKTDSFDLSWDGFIDHESGVKKYFVALFQNNENRSLVINFTDVSLQTSVTLTNLALMHGKTYFGAVKAMDAAGHESDVIFSQPKIVDTTGPTSFTCAETNLIYNLSNNKNMTGIIGFPGTFEPNSMYTVSGSLSPKFRYPHVKLAVENKVGKNIPLQASHDGHLQFKYSFYPSLVGTYNVTLETQPSSSIFKVVQVIKCKMTVAEDNENALTVRQISEDYFTTSINVIDLESGIKRTNLGIGSSPKGYQLKPLYPIDVNTDETFRASVSHRTPVYATAIVENYAGLRTVFRSRKLLTDHTPPTLQNIFIQRQEVMDSHFSNLTDLSGDTTVIRLKVSWNARDEESGIKSCFVSVGSMKYVDDKQAYHLAPNGLETTTEELKVCHGETMYVNVKCVNNIEMTTIKASEPVIISVKPPIMDEANLTFIPSSMFMTSDTEIAIQSNRTYLQLYWEGFKDISGISSYEYRLSSKTVNVTDWAGPAIKDFVSFNALGLEDGQTYIGEVHALNSGQLRSDVVNSTILIDTKEPQMTGQPITVNRKGTTVTLDWNNVFSETPDIPRRYDVVVGSAKGFNDILDKSSVISDTQTFVAPETTILTKHVNTLFIYVSAIHPTGRRTTYSTTYRLS